MGQPDEVAYLALFLCSEQASFLTGVDYPLDGVSLICTVSFAGPAGMNSMIIDAHQHFWQYDPCRHGWITEAMASCSAISFPLTWLRTSCKITSTEPSQSRRKLLCARRNFC